MGASTTTPRTGHYPTSTVWKTSWPPPSTLTATRKSGPAAIRHHPPLVRNSRLQLHPQPQLVPRREEQVLRLRKQRYQQLQQWYWSSLHTWTSQTKAPVTTRIYQPCQTQATPLMTQPFRSLVPSNLYGVPRPPGTALAPPPIPLTAAAARLCDIGRRQHMSSSCSLSMSLSSRPGNGHYPSS